MLLFAAVGLGRWTHPVGTTVWSRSRYNTILIIQAVLSGNRVRSVALLMSGQEATVVSLGSEVRTSVAFIPSWQSASQDTHPWVPATMCKGSPGHLHWVPGTASHLPTHMGR